jgi:hypothetical protein
MGRPAPAVPGEPLRGRLGGLRDPGSPASPPVDLDGEDWPPPVSAAAAASIRATASCKTVIASSSRTSGSGHFNFLFLFRNERMNSV